MARGRTLQPTQSLPSIPSSSGIFRTANETAAEAAIIVKHSWGTRELQPFGSPSDPYHPLASSSDVDALALSPRTMAHRLAFENGEVRLERRGQKRGEAGAEEEGGSDTDVDEAEEPQPQRALPNVSDDFPPVFSAPPSQPELFGDDRKRMPPPPVPIGRQVRGLPRRTGLSKAASAPVGRLGAGFMDVDGDDGFDIDDWAKEQGGFDVAHAAQSDQF